MSDTARQQTVILGLGNPLMGDDGIGIAALERLRQGWIVPEAVRLVDGGTWGMNLLPLIEEASELLILDAIDRAEPPGRIIVLERQDVPRFLGLKLSPHQIGLCEVLALADLRGGLPDRIVAMGLQPARVEMRSGLTPEVEAELEHLLLLAVDRLCQWGHVVERLEAVAGA